VGREKTSLSLGRLPIKLFLRLGGKKNVVGLTKYSDHKPIIVGVW
jgi:hypothetical protein